MSSSVETPPELPPAQADFGKSMLSGASSLLESDMFSDLKIVCGDGVGIPAHRLVLFSQSGFFKKALTVNMKEKSEGIIRLPEGSVLVRNMLRFLYTADYERRAFLDTAKLYAMAIKYDIKPLQKLVQSSFLRDAKEGLRKAPRPIEGDMAKHEEGFFSAVELIYQNTFEQSDELRLGCADIVRDGLLELMRNDASEKASKVIERITAHSDIATDVMRGAFSILADDYDTLACCAAAGCAKKDDAEAGTVALRKAESAELRRLDVVMVCPLCKTATYLSSWKVRAKPS